MLHLRVLLICHLKWNANPAYLALITQEISSKRYKRYENCRLRGSFAIIKCFIYDICCLGGMNNRRFNRNQKFLFFENFEWQTDLTSCFACLSERFDKHKHFSSLNTNLRLYFVILDFYFDRSQVCWDIFAFCFRQFGLPSWQLGDFILMLNKKNPIFIALNTMKNIIIFIYY